MADDRAKDEKPKEILVPASAADLRWTTASSGVREAAKWLATAIGAIAGVVLGAGPLIQADTDYSEWGAGKWILVLVLAAAAALFAGAVVGRLLSTLIPVEVTLDQLPPDLKARIESNQLEEYLPGDTQSLQQFKNRLVGYTRAAAELGAYVKNLPEKDTDKPRLQARLLILEANRDKYLTKRNEIYALAKYEIERNRLTSVENRRALSAYLVLAVLALTSFTFVTGDTSGGESDDDTVAPAAAFLQPRPGSEKLWESLGLSECSLEGEDDPIPVFLLAEEEDAYRVQTLGTPQGCPRYVFTIDKEYVDPVRVEPLEVTVEDD